MTPLVLLDDALQRGERPEVLTQIFDLVKRIRSEEQRMAFYKAMAAAKAALPPIVKNRIVSFGPGKAAYKYADLGQIDNTIREELGDNGLFYTYESDVVSDGKIIVISCIVAHEQGHFTKTSLPGPHDTSGSKNQLQAQGSTVEYLMRQTLRLALGLSTTDDDDGQASGGGGLTPEQFANLQSHIEKVGLSPQKFCERFKISDVSKLPPEKLDDAHSAIQAWATAKATGGQS